MTSTRVIVEADGGSRGNPGPAAYGAILRDANTGHILAQVSEKIGIATNNVAEYRGLVAGLTLAIQHAPGASIEVRMDSKLVVEQMMGNWRIKHPDMRSLADRAQQVAPPGTRYTWIPRAENTAADALVNRALDGESTPANQHDATTRRGLAAEPAAAVGEGGRGSHTASAAAPARGWASDAGPVTTVILLRHGVTAQTVQKTFAGGLSGSDPALIDEGWEQARRLAQWLRPLQPQVAGLVASPLQRTQQTAAAIAEELQLAAQIEPGFAETEFGAWDGLTFGEISAQYPRELSAWLNEITEPAGKTGESFVAVAERVFAARDRLIEDYEGKTVVVVSHVTPIKILTADAVGAPIEALFRMELAAASASVVSYFTTAEGAVQGSLQLYNARPGEFGWR